MNSEVFVIRSSNPLDMEGYADVEAVHADAEIAQGHADALNKAAFDVAAANHGKDRANKFAIRFSVEPWGVIPKL